MTKQKGRSMEAATAFTTSALQSQDMVSETELSTEGVERSLRWYLDNRTGDVSFRPEDQNVLALCLQIAAMTDTHHLAEVAKHVSENPNFDQSTSSLHASFNSVSDAELWENRDKSLKEQPVDFIKRIHGNRLDGFFNLSDLKRLDPKLYKSYYNWIGRPWNERPSLSELNLPTKQEVNDRLISKDINPMPMADILLQFVPSEVRAIRKAAFAAKTREWRDSNVPKIEA